MQRNKEDTEMAARKVCAAFSRALNIYIGASFDVRDLTRDEVNNGASIVPCAEGVYNLCWRDYALLQVTTSTWPEVSIQIVDPTVAGRWDA